MVAIVLVVEMLAPEIDTHHRAVDSREDPPHFNTHRGIQDLLTRAREHPTVAIVLVVEMLAPEINTHHGAVDREDPPQINTHRAVNE